MSRRSAPKSSKKCYLLALPYEIREKIWSELFVKPVAICPEFIHFGVSMPQGYIKKSPNQYGYTWEGARQKDNDTKCLPWVLGRYLETYSERPATAKESAGGAKMGLKKYGVDSFTQYAVFASAVNGQKTYLMKYRDQYAISPIKHIRLLRVCKQIHSECTDVLYSRNTWSFHFTADAKYHHPVHFTGDLAETPHLIPGLANKDGHPQAPEEVEEAIDHLFSGKFQARFVYYDPLFRFLRAIGRRNASCITKVKLEGHFKTENPNKTMGFATMLPVHTTVLSHICPRLQKLTLRDGTQALDGQNLFWEFEKKKKRPASHYIPGQMVYREMSRERKPDKSDQEYIDEAVEHVVQGLPFLQELQLGEFMDWFRTPWAKAKRWEAFVQARARSQKAERSRGLMLLKEEADDVEVDLTGVDMASNAAAV